MIAYHGSTLKNLEELKFSEDTSRFGEANLLYGQGIYLTESIEEAKAYATTGSIYKVQIKGNILDTRDFSEITDFINQVSTKLSFDLSTIPEISDIIPKVNKGHLAGSHLNELIFEIISNTEYLYFSIIADLFNEDSDAVSDIIDELFQEYSTIALDRNGSCWFICKDFSGSCLTILEEIEVN